MEISKCGYEAKYLDHSAFQIFEPIAYHFHGNSSQCGGCTFHLELLRVEIAYDAHARRRLAHGCAIRVQALMSFELDSSEHNARGPPRRSGAVLQTTEVAQQSTVVQRGGRTESRAPIDHCLQAPTTPALVADNATGAGLDHHKVRCGFPYRRPWDRGGGGPTGRFRWRAVVQLSLTLSA